MIYFLPWVVFLMLVVLSVPIAAMLEKRKTHAAYGPSAGDEGGFTDDDNVESFEGDEGAEFAEAEGEFASEGGDDAGGGDFGDEDLSAFEEIR